MNLRCHPAYTYEDSKVKTMSAGGAVWTWTFLEPNGFPLKATIKTDPTGALTTYAFDPSTNALASVAWPTGKLSTFSYNGDALVTKEMIPAGTAISVVFNTAGGRSNTQFRVARLCGQFALSF